CSSRLGEWLRGRVLLHRPDQRRRRDGSLRNQCLEMRQKFAPPVTLLCSRGLFLGASTKCYESVWLSRLYLISIWLIIEWQMPPEVIQSETTLRVQFS